MPRAKKQPKDKQEIETQPEIEYDGQYLTDNEEEFEPLPKVKKPQPKRKYRKRTPRTSKGKKGKKQIPTVLIEPTQNKQYQSNLLNSATKMKRMFNINRDRLNTVTNNEEENQYENDNQAPLMRPMNNTLDYSKVHFIPRGLLNGIKSAKAKAKGIRTKRLTKRVKLPKGIMDKIKEAQQAMKTDKQTTVLPGYKLGKCPKCGNVHMLPAGVTNEVSGYESDNEDYNNNNNENYNNNEYYNNNENYNNQLLIPQQGELLQPKKQEHYRKTGLVYTSTTTNGIKSDMGHYVINNSDNNAVVKGVIKDGIRKEVRIPRK